MFHEGNRGKPKDYLFFYSLVLLSLSLHIVCKGYNLYNQNQYYDQTRERSHVGENLPPTKSILNLFS